MTQSRPIVMFFALVAVLSLTGALLLALEPAPLPGPLSKVSGRTTLLAAPDPARE